MTREAGESAARAINERSRHSLGAAPDLVAFHWWDYGDSRFVEAARHLTSLRDEGLLGHVAACNFDLPHLKALVAAGVPVVSNQVQHSLPDGITIDVYVCVCARAYVDSTCPPEGG